jgi:hypothetical protein
MALLYRCLSSVPVDCRCAALLLAKGSSTCICYHSAEHMYQLDHWDGKLTEFVH